MGSATRKAVDAKGSALMLDDDVGDTAGSVSIGGCDLQLIGAGPGLRGNIRVALTATVTSLTDAER
jgi:hypothetical protein